MEYRESRLPQAIALTGRHIHTSRYSRIPFKLYPLAYVANDMLNSKVLVVDDLHHALKYKKRWYFRRDTGVYKCKMTSHA